MAIVAQLAVVCSACSSGPPGLALPSTTVPPGRLAHPLHGNALEVSGNLIHLASGPRFVVKGVVVYALPFYYDNQAVDQPLMSVTDQVASDPQGLFATIRATGANTVRIPLSALVYNDNRYGPGGPTGYLERLRAVVRAASAAGLHVVLSWWDALGEGSALLADYKSQFPMMRTVATMFRHNNRVVYEPYNEPNGMTWDQWIVLMERTLSYWRADIGYRGLLIADTPMYSWDFEPVYVRRLLQYDAALLGHADLVVANHRYPNGSPCFCGAERASWVAKVGQYVRQFPILGTEYGIADGIGPAELGWARGFLSYLSSTAIPSGFNGAIGFVWNWVDADTMTDPVTHQLNAWGDVAVSELLSRHFVSAATRPASGVASSMQRSQ